MRSSTRGRHDLWKWVFCDGVHRHTDAHTDMATYWPTRPSGFFTSEWPIYFTPKPCFKGILNPEALIIASLDLKLWQFCQIGQILLIAEVALRRVTNKATSTGFKANWYYNLYLVRRGRFLWLFLFGSKRFFDRFNFTLKHGFSIGATSSSDHFSEPNLIQMATKIVKNIFFEIKIILPNLLFWWWLHERWQNNQKKEINVWL